MSNYKWAEARLVQPGLFFELAGTVVEVVDLQYDFGRNLYVIVALLKFDDIETRVSTAIPGWFTMTVWESYEDWHKDAYPSLYNKEHQARG